MRSRMVAATAVGIGIGVAVLHAAEPAAPRGLDEELLAEYEQADTEAVTAWDPIAPWNRVMFEVNDRLYFYALKPLARGYAAVVPERARVGVKRAFTNLAAPVRIVNCLLQAEFEGTVTETGRFLVNTTAGVLGFRDAAANMAALREPRDEDFGQTLGTYRVANGPYLVWPLFGPSTLRDTVGLVGDRFLDPLTYVDPWYVSAGLSATDRVNATSLRLGDYEAFKKSAVEPYAAMRDAYMQHRAAAVAE